MMNPVVLGKHSYIEGMGRLSCCKKPTTKHNTSEQPKLGIASTNTRSAPLILTKLGRHDSQGGPTSIARDSEREILGNSDCLRPTDMHLKGGHMSPGILQKGRQNASSAAVGDLLVVRSAGQ
ncbi:glyceraldehyde-3-phosphate dehydrogenase [Striga asiatica]|uniref:Glyceraldehyde-3-phosphate dehydrogenase n=1 Tax=Striga asiatica TaxID=4170 RepID=A0A5A7RIS4_STRAF|nr:glyceraldehyde-3-phosphate dehydrogenase [Striga asiatica]